jgi:NNP family nitrate/nitrite transporter-like MFS transporter
MTPLTVECLALAIALGLGTGAVFTLVAQWFPGEVGAVTGVVGAAGGLGGFFPPLVMGIAMSATGSYTIDLIENGRHLATVHGRTARRSIPGGGYVRAVVTRDDGKRAWVQPAR